MASTGGGHSQPPSSSAPSLPWTRKPSNLFSTFIFRLIFRSDFTVNRRLLLLFDRKVPPSSTPLRGVASFDTAAFSSSPHLWARVYNPVTDLRRCFLAGESAGGNIAHHVAVRAAEHRQFKRLRIAGLISIQPFFGGEERTESELRFGSSSEFRLNLELTDWFWKAFLPAGSDREHPAANVVRSDISGLDFPPTLLVIGGLDLLKHRTKEYGEWLKKSGKEVRVVEYPNGIHGSTWNLDLPEYSMLMQDTIQFTKSI